VITRTTATRNLSLQGRRQPHGLLAGSEDKGHRRDRDERQPDRQKDLVEGARPIEAAIEQAFHDGARERGGKKGDGQRGAEGKTKP
jgi:hypothetical protein